MLRTFVFLLLALAPAMAAAGIRATFAAERDRPTIVVIADNGDIDAELWTGARLIVKGGRAFIVEERLTGPIVTRLEDLGAIVAERAPAPVTPATAPAADWRPVERGTAVVNGRSGRAYFLPRGVEGELELFAVISGDPDLAQLAAAMRRLYAAEMLVAQARDEVPQRVSDTPSWLQLLDEGVPLRLGHSTLRTVEHLPIAPEAVVLPAEPETREALRVRLAGEAAEAERGPSADDMISRAVFAGGRLFVLTDSGGLSSLAEGERARIRHDPGEPVLDICVDGGELVALTGRRDGGRAWTMRRWRGGQWRTARSVARSGDRLLAMACAPESAILLTSRRLIDLSGPDARVLILSGEPLRTLVNTVVHATPDAVFVGINAGEWGGGLRRIERRSGRISTIARNATGNLCDGPLNTDCDPVHGIVTLPWRPECVAAAIGLIHMAAHGRIVTACPQGVEQLFAAADAIDETDPTAVAEAASGSYGAVAFFGLAAIDRTLVAVGHNGLHRIAADGTATRQRWPRFIDADGVLVSFALPDVILVLTSINRRASVGGAAPILVVR
jgi:hypothetical protein